jgi:tetratricopeptide (TPR) repeat protein/tRNA A-37 threonylcarbamoyl transferase component Bud32/TolB-like protein
MKPEDLTGRVIAHYKILTRLGEGGMGVVYQAEDTRLKRVVALKFIRPEIGDRPDAKTRFRREAQSSAALNHPHIATIHEIGETADGQLYIAMEYLDGPTLRDKLRDGPLELSEGLAWAEQMAAGLEAAHDLGIIHRDIKTANIIISRKESAKIMDFGLARSGQEAETTRTAAVMGTVSYMSPEQASGESFDQRSDIWSFGIVLYEMFAGRNPFRAENEQATLHAILTRKPVPLTVVRRDAPHELERIVAKCLEKKPEKRYQRTADLRADLGRLHRAVSSRTLTASGMKIPRPGLAYRFKKHKNRILFTLTALAVLILAGFLIRPVRGAVGRWLGFRMAPPEINLAVLPFDVIGGEDKDKAFSAGLIELLTNKLTQVERFQGTLRVVPAIEARQLERPSAGRVWQVFKANRAITGSIQFFEDEVIVTLNLVDTKTVRQLKSRDITMSRRSQGGLPAAVSNAAAQVLDLEIEPRTRQAWAARDACEPDAATFTIQARGYLQRFENEDSVNIAIGLFKRAIEMVDPSCASAYAGLGEAYVAKYGLTYDKGLIDAAQAAAEQALRLNKDLPETHVILGILNRVKGRYPESVRELELAFQMDPLNYGAVRQLGATYEDSGKLDEAEKAYRKSISLRPDDWSGYNYLGGFYYARGRYDDAEKNFLQITELTPDNTRGFDLLGAVYLQTGRNDKAIAMFEKSIGLKPAPAACSNLGTAYFYAKRYADAASMYERAISLGANEEASWGNLGDAYRFLPGQETKARQAYETAVRLTRGKIVINPNDGILRNRIARYYALLGDRTKALEEIALAQKYSSDNADVLETSVQVYELLGLRDKALESLRDLARRGSLELIEINPDLAKLREDPRYRAILGARKPAGQNGVK